MAIQQVRRAGHHSLPGDVGRGQLPDNCRARRRCQRDLPGGRLPVRRSPRLGGGQLPGRGGTNCLAICHTANGGSSWVLNHTDIAVSSIEGLDFANADHGCLIADGQRILRTTDGGLNWAEDRMAGRSCSLRRLDLTGPSQGFAAGWARSTERATVFEYSVTDGRWNESNVDRPGTIHALAAGGPQRVWAAGLRSGRGYIGLHRAGSAE